MGSCRNALLGCALLGAGCNALFGIEQTELVLEDDGPGPGGSGGRSDDAVGGGAGGSRAGASTRAGSGGSGNVDEGGAAGTIHERGGNAATGAAGRGGTTATGGMPPSTGGAHAAGTANEAGSSGADGSECTEERTRCGTLPKEWQTCRGGSWVDESPCEFVCVEGQCSECELGSMSCNEDDLEICNSKSGRWEVYEHCEYECKAGTCWDCEPTTKECSSVLAFRTCDGVGRWGEPTACPNQACYDGECVGECTPGQVRCHEGTAETCNNLGDWSGISCRSDEICALSADTVDCIDNSPYAYGFAELFDGSFAQPSEGMMMLVRLPEFQTRANVNEAELLSLGLLAEGDPGVYARIALYTEMDGLPYQYKLSSRDEISVTDNPEGCASISRPCSSVGNSNSFMLNDGDRYWLGVVFSSHPSNLLVRQRAGSNLGSKIVMIPHQFSAQFPVTLSPNDLVTYAAVEWNLFVTVKDTSP